jgi:hypothetical protein
MPIAHRFNAKIELVSSHAEAPNSGWGHCREVLMFNPVGEAVDKLITIEAKYHGMLHGIMQPMYADAMRGYNLVSL